MLQGGCYFMTAEENIRTLRRSIQAVNDRDLSIASQLITPGFVRHDLSGAFGEIKGLKEVTNYIQLVLKALPDAQVKVEDIFATEKRAALRITISGTHQGEFLGTAPTGKKVELNQINLYRFEEGKIAETWQLMDVLGFMRQTGASTT